MRSACVVTVVALLVGSAVAACSSTTSAPLQGSEAGAPDVDGGVTPDTGADVVPGFPSGRGPGAFGALPSGYCCTKDAECWGRHCGDVGSGERMCLDLCVDASSCDVPKTPFDCKAPAGTTRKRCSPPAGVKCVPAADFVQGTKAVGDCCAYAPGQAGGAECASHVCGSFGDGPDMCLNRCTVQADCLAGYKCETQGAEAGYVPTCLPLAVFSGGTYTCK
jgi:hypothetical protein